VSRAGQSELLREYTVGGPGNPPDTSPRYFARHGDDGHYWFPTEAEAIKSATSLLDEIKSSGVSEDGWPDDVEHITWGIELGGAVVVARGKYDDHPAFDEWVEYEMQPYPDSVVAERDELVRRLAEATTQRDALVAAAEETLASLGGSDNIAPSVVRLRNVLYRVAGPEVADVPSR
jgi:hypothetical protein